jgi:4-hydroxy-tetrahydrodipicolinate synthase
MLKLQGAFTALVTPFDSQLRVDDAALDRLVDAQLAGGIAGIVPCGTTGESPTLDDEEHIGVIAKVVKRVNKRCPVIGGTGSNSTREAINLSKGAVEVGADAVMIVMPYYNKPTQAGLVDHCVKVAEAVKGTPVVLYNVPGRTASDLLPESVEAICKAASNVVAIKEATGNVLRAQELHRRLGDRLTILSGDDALTLGMMACGARGVISVTSNIFPKQVQHVCELALAGKWDEAKRAHLALVPVHDVMFVESNPGPVKAALAATNVLVGNVRAPLAMPAEASVAKVLQVVETYRNSGAR